MKKSAMMTLASALVLLVAAGCATTSGDPVLTDEEQIAKQLQEGIASIVAKDYSLFEKSVSDDFYSNVIGNKEDLLDYLKNADDMGFLDDLEVDLSEAAIVVDGDKASISGITAKGAFGSQPLTFDGVKENGVWLITGLSPF